MKTLDRYILRQLLAVTCMGVLALTTLMLLGQLFKELHALLVESGASPSIVVDFILQVIPFSLSFSVPWGFLTAVLLVYGRLAADNELTSMRMAGLSLWRLSMPAIGMGLVFSALCYHINTEIAPKGRQAMSDLVVQAAMENPRNLLKASQDAVKMDKVKIYIEGRSGDTLQGVHIYPISNDEDANPLGTGAKFSSIHAQKADIGEFDEKTRQLSLIMRNCVLEHNSGGQTDMPFIEELPMRVHIPIDRDEWRIKTSYMTNAEMTDALQRKSITARVDMDAIKDYARAADAAPAFPCAAQLWAAAKHDTELVEDNLTESKQLALETEYTKRASFACACLVFSIIGVPLAITARRRDTSTGFAIGILVAAVYFLALVFCDLSRKVPGILPYIVLWIPNVAGLAFGIWQHQRAKYRG